MRVLFTANAANWGFDTGVLPGVFVGSLIGALLGHDFKFEGFKTENKPGHYLSGAILVGFGAVLAGGCTVGAGMTGGAIFCADRLADANQHLGRCGHGLASEQKYGLGSLSPLLDLYQLQVAPAA